MSDPEDVPPHSKNGNDEKENRPQILAAFWDKTKKKCKTDALKAYARSKKWTDGSWWFQEREPLNRFTGWLMAYTCVLVIVSALQFCTIQNTDTTTHDALVAANRAWVAPVSADFIVPPVVGERMQVRMTYRNVGHSPALKFHSGMQMFTVAADKNGGFVNPHRDFCKEVSFPGIGAVFPVSPPDYTLQFPELAVFEADVESRKSIAIWDVCFKYETFGKERKTSACFYLRPSATNHEWYWQNCGEQAD